MLAVVPALFIPALFAIAMTAFVGIMLAYKAKRDAARKAAMEALSTSLGATFSEKDAYGLKAQLAGFELFKRERKWFTRNGKITNVIRSTVGDTEVFMFDYTYVVSTGKSSRRVTQTVFFANDKQWFLPDFHLRPERWWHKIMSGMGMKDINFEENPEFSDKFWLKSEFEDLIRKQFTPSLQAFMLEKPPVHLEGKNFYLLAYKPDKLLSPEESRKYFENCCALVRLLQTEGKTELLQLAGLELEQKPIELPPQNA